MADVREITDSQNETPLTGEDSTAQPQQGAAQEEPAEAREERIEDLPIAEVRRRIQAAKAAREVLLKRDELRRLQEELRVLEEYERHDGEDDPQALPARGAFALPALPLREEEQSIPGSRAQTDTSEDTPQLKHIKPEKLQKYRGRNQREHLEFFRSAETAFRLDSAAFATERSKVLYVMQYLEGEPRESWFRHVESIGWDNIPSWIEFEAFLLDLVDDPVNREREAMQRFMDAKQGPTQSAQAFHAYLSAIEAQLMPYTEHQNNYHYFTKLRDELRIQLVNFGALPPTRELTVSRAATLEKNLAKANHSVSRTTAPRRMGDGDPMRKRKYHERVRETYAEKIREAPKGPTAVPQQGAGVTPQAGACHNCGKIGHWAKDCRSWKPGKRTGPEVHSQVHRAVEIERGLDTTAVVQRADGAKTAHTLLDTGASINIVSQHKAVEWDLVLVDADLPTPSWLNDSKTFCYGAYEVEFSMTDSAGHARSIRQLFYATDSAHYDLILGMSGMKAGSIRIDVATRQWRWGDAASSEGVALLRAEAGSEDPLTNEVLEKALLLSVEAKEATQRLDGLPDALQEYEDVFSEKAAGILPPHRATDHAINTADHEPPHYPIYNLSEKELAVLRDYLRDAEAKGWIRRSTSPAGAPILFVPKKDGSLRLCVDYRGLNKITIKDRHPLPLISETLDRLMGSIWFTKLDLTDAYHRIRIREGDEWKTAFRTRYGHYEYLVMPFGLANAPATFQAYINRALAGLVDYVCVVYLDDILIYSRGSLDDHWVRVKSVLNRLRGHALYAKLKKCEFAVPEVEYLGYIVGREGVSMDPRRVSDIKDWPQPKSYHDVQVFLGFCNFYRRFIRAYSRIAAPLTGLLVGSKDGRKAGPLEWTDDAANAFRTLRDAFTEAPVLRHFDPMLPIRMETDASDYAIAAILSQLRENGEWHPIAYWSRKMVPAERNYETYDGELLAIVCAFQQWRHYLDGAAQPIQVLTDHNNLKGFMDLKALTPRQARWAVKLAAFDFVIEHRPGKTNPADAPSRRPDYYTENHDLSRLLPTLQNKLARVASIQAWPKAWALPLLPKEREKEEKANKRATAANSWRGDDTPPLRPLWRGIRNSLPRAVVATIAAREVHWEKPHHEMHELVKLLQAEDEFAQSKRSELGATARRKGAAGDSQAWTKRDGLLYRRDALYIPQDSAVKTELLYRSHDAPTAGHFGVARTLELLQRKYYWPNMAQEVKEYVATCDVCQRMKVQRHRPYGALQSLPMPDGPFQELTMDFVTGLPPSKARGSVHDAILVIVDRYTKVALYIACSKTITATQLADIFVERVISRYGTPKGIVSDRGTVFTSAFWQEICVALKVRRRLSTAFHPQTDGQTERQNQTLELYLRVYCSDKQDDWAKLLPLAEFAYNSTLHATIKKTPFQLLYGFEPELHYDSTSVPQAKVPDAAARVERLHRERQALASRWLAAQESQAKYYDQKRSEKCFAQGDLVLLSAKNLSLKLPARKLSPKFIGPFQVLEPVGARAYRLRLPPQYKIHPVFHVSLLEPYKMRIGNASAPQYTAPEIIGGEEEWELEEIVEKAISNTGVHYKVKWLGWPQDYNQWLPENELRNAKELVQAFEQRATHAQADDQALGQRPRRGRPRKKQK
ncbi:hypothetical protein MBLNU459_g0615t2 [Dothideomycetes sp. NU459]